MNISETAVASATANALSDVSPPSRAVALTRIGSPTTFSTSSENERLSSARRANAIVWSTFARPGDPGGSSLRACSRFRCGALEAEHVEVPP